MNLARYSFSRKCDIGLCQNQADFCLQGGAKGQLLMCSHHLAELNKLTSNIVGKKVVKAKQTKEEILSE